jgi:hypothetical protein
MQSYEFFLVWAIGVMRWGGWGRIKKDVIGITSFWGYVFWGVYYK